MDEDAAAALLVGQEQLWPRGPQVGNNIRGRGRGRADHNVRGDRGANNNVRQGRGAHNNVRQGRGANNNVRQGRGANNNVRQGRGANNNVRERGGPHNNVRQGQEAHNNVRGERLMNEQPANAIYQQRERGGNQDQRARNDNPYQARRGNNNRIANDDDEGDAREHRQNRPLGYRALQEIVQAEGPDLLTKLNGRSKAFAVLLDQTIESPDIYVLVIKLVAKACLLAFEQLKMQLLLDICNSKFINNLRNYLTDLPYVPTGDRRKNNLYWSKPKEFWEDLICFYEFIIMRSPSTALQKCRALIDSATKASLNDLRDRTGFVLSNDSNTKLKQLCEKLLLCEIEEEKKVQRYQHPEISVNEEPPEDFRQVSVLPTREDLMNDRPFLRPNIVKGVYRDIHHYLDVQFRLLREDCIGPLRTGIIQFINTPKKKRFDNIRVFKDVKFIGPYTSQSNVGVMVQFEDISSKRFKRMNWVHSKRLLFGSLLIFTNNNFESFFLATVLERDLKFLEKGQVAVSIVESPETMTAVQHDVAYMMVESEVYFEPYYHVLRALQDPTFPNQMAMKKYIVDVDPVPQNPAYLQLDTEYTLELKLGYPQKVRILDADSWPTADDLGLNNSQRDAFKLALLHEFAVIQGPPGTGKTFIGVKVAQTLIENVEGARLLLICFTNHALDQFLEAILPITESLARIGGQSRCEALQKYNLVKLRNDAWSTGRSITGQSQRLFAQKRFELKAKVTQLQAKQEELEMINYDGVISYRTLREDEPGIRCLERYYDIKQDPLLKWLFEHLEYNGYNEDIEIDGEIIPPQANLDEDVDEQRLDLDLDDLDISTDDVPSISTSFKLKNEQDKLTRLRKAIRANKGTHRNLDDLRAEVQFTSLMIKRFKDMQVIKNIVPNEPMQFDVNRDPRTYSIADRWTLYFGLVRKHSERLRNEIRPLQNTQQEAFTAYEEARQILDLQVLKNVKVVGMTTTGAARLKKLVQTLAPDIVIVEEAAEVMESHIVTALSSSCKHLILIGDHQQLRPSAASYRLARDYNLEVSLFERMIANKIHSRRLDVQHRMRPEIAALITPSIYEELHNHASVESFPHVRGVENNLFFLSHEFKESSVEDTSSRSNEREGDLCLRLANYLMQQGYDPEHVTILAAYSGQMFYMRKERPNYAFLSKVKITVVDNYQGEESKIIILSLVRNNDENKIGFLGTVNRVCVALSRAREGFYMFGNIEILKRSADIWTKIAATLEDSGSLGTSLRLKCENHPNQKTDITQPAHFDKVPEGGCLLKCDANLRCGHLCPLICHGYDRGHVEIECPLPCDRIICELSHVCPLRCTQECKPCMVLVRKTLPCKHEMMVFCHQDPTEPGVKCMTTLTVKLPHCGHEAKKPCYLDINLVKCHIPCEFRVDPCGHKCRQKCHVTDDPDHTRYTCEKPCALANKGCTAGLVGDRGDHQCKKKCHETCNDCLVEVVKKRTSCSHLERVACCKDVNEVTCRKYCKRSLPCGHFCKKKCFEDCGDCKQMVKKTIPSCGHEIRIECRTEATSELCRTKCERKLPCGHPCTGRCDQPCNPDKCTRLIECGLPAPCGHKVDLPCNVYRTYIAGERDRSCLLRHCASPCAVTLACGHACGGGCGACRQGRLHAPCTQTCRQDNICGHQCQEPCNQVCPPCKRPCEVRCVHTRCNKICGAPCAPCQEKCERACDHGRCVRRCAEPCAPFQPCSEPCAKRLNCGHRCRGLCGEPCPQICKECNPDDFPRDFLGDDFEEDDKFVKLQDCPHVMEVENMDNLMTGDRESISIRACPYCRAAVINTPRYKDLTNAMFRDLINPIKEKVYGTKGQIKAKQVQLTGRAVRFAIDHESVLKGEKHWSAAFSKIFRVIKRNDAGANLSLLQLEMYSVYLDILELLADCFDKFKKANITVLGEEYSAQMKLICNTLADNMQKLSQQQQKDIGNEIKRTHAIIQLATIMSNPAFLRSKTVSKVATATDAAKRAILSWYVYEDDNAHETLKVLQDAVNLSGIITRQEKDLIVKAMGLKQGHWYKCPNGHIYCITECGGAMVESKCNECGARIGGGSHRLRSDNAVATEMDGATHSAWSNVYNNMANWRLD